MGHPAQKIEDGRGRHPETPESKQRERLMRDLFYRIAELGRMRDGWDGSRSKAPSEDVIKRAADLGYNIIGSSDPMPRSLNLGAVADGAVQMCVTGADGREADLWIYDGAGEFTFVAEDQTGELIEQRCRIANYFPLAEWLAGRAAKLPDAG